MAKRRQKARSRQRGGAAHEGGNRAGRRRLDETTAGAIEALPALDSLSDLPSFEELAPSAAQREAFERDLATLGGEGIDASEVELACVMRLDRSFPAVVCASGVCRAEFSFRFGIVHEPSAVVGDWVVLRRPSDHDMAVIEFVLPRTNEIARWRGGARGKRQVLAANVDTVLVVQALGAGDVSLDRIARSGLIAADSSAQVAVVLTKGDRASAQELHDQIASVRALLGRDAPLVVTTSSDDETVQQGVRVAAEAGGGAHGLDAVRSLVPPGSIAIVLGESGAGKSTLLNALLGHESLGTGSVRERDDAGRHTTVARRMVSLPEAGIVVDEPGLRSLPIVGHERGLALLFPEVAEEAARCRFRDCTHTHEPGCAVQAALAEGRCEKVRVETYVSLAAEMRTSSTSLDPDVTL